MQFHYSGRGRSKPYSSSEKEQAPSILVDYFENLDIERKIKEGTELKKVYVYVYEVRQLSS